MMQPIFEEDSEALNALLAKLSSETKEDKLIIPSLPLGYAPEVSGKIISNFLDKKSHESAAPLPMACQYTGADLAIFEPYMERQRALGGDKDMQLAEASKGTVPINYSQVPGEENGAAISVRPRVGCNEVFFSYWLNETMKFFRAVGDNPYFDNFILAVIMLSSLALALENPYISDTFQTVLETGDMCWIVIFTIEFVVKISGQGAREYWADAWNKLDCLVLLFTYFSKFGPGGASGIGRIFRIGRTLRPLRMINRNPEMKLIINSIIGSLPAVSNALILAGFGFFVFAVFGLNSFMGKLFTCNDGGLSEKECVGSVELETDGEDVFLMPHVWSDRRNNFNNIFNALVTLFEAATTEGWVDLMYATMDIPDEEWQAPVYNNYPLFSFYWVLFIFVCTFFVVQLFVGVIIDNYNREMNILTDEQKRWVLLRRVMLNMGPDPLVRPKGAFRLMVYRVVRSQAFDTLIVVLVLVNTLFMAMAYWNMTDALTAVLSNVNYFFVGAFAAEMVVKLIAFGFRQYLMDTWNVFDAIIVMGSLVTMFYDAGAIAQVGRVFRIARLLKIVKRAKGLKTLFNTMLTSLPSMANISSLMFLLYFIYAIIGITLFGKTRLQDYYTNDANFRDFPNGLLVLFRMSTGENWHEIMGNCEVTEPDCSPIYEDCGLPMVSQIYFISFYMFGVYLMLNLFIAVIIDNFSNCYSKESNLITSDHLEEYRALWRKFDEGGGGKIPFTELRPFITRLCLENNQLADNLLLDRVLYGMIYSDMRNYAMAQPDFEDAPGGVGYIYFTRLCESLCIVQMERDAEANYLTPVEKSIGDEKQRKLKRDVAASVIGSSIRGFLARKRYQAMKKRNEELRLKREMTHGEEESPISPRSPRSGKKSRKSQKKSPKTLPSDENNKEKV